MRPADAVTNVIDINTNKTDDQPDQQALDEIQTVIDQLEELSSPTEVPNVQQTLYELDKVDELDQTSLNELDAAINSLQQALAPDPVAGVSNKHTETIDTFNDLGPVPQALPALDVEEPKTKIRKIDRKGPKPGPLCTKPGMSHLEPGPSNVTKKSGVTKKHMEPKPGPSTSGTIPSGVANPVPSTSGEPSKTAVEPKPGPSGVVKRREPVPSTSKGPKPGQSTSKVKKNNAAGAFNPMYIAKNTTPETSVYKKIKDQKLYFSTKLFEKMARAIQHEYITRYKEDHRNPTRTPLRFGDGVLDKIQFGFEQMIVEATTASFECTVHRNRTTIKRKDVERAGKILESSRPFLHQP